MKKRTLAALLCAVLLLGGCSGLLNREYSLVTVHSAAPTVDSDQLTIRVESYQDLVNALIYFINQGQETGTIRLYNYPYDVELDLEGACAEVSQEDPVGAYAVASIRCSVTPIVSCYEANIQIDYRRTPEQVAAVIPVTGASAIRTQLREALAAYREEIVLRLSYFDGDEEYLQALLREAYCSTPETALDFPRASVRFYPEDGRQRIAEITFAYQLSRTDLAQRRQELDRLAGQISNQVWDALGDEGLLSVRQAILETAEYDPEGGSTAYHALAEHRADSLGLAMAMSLLCRRLEFPCLIVEGTVDGTPHCWNIVSTQSGYRHLDLSRPPETEGVPPFRSDRDMFQAGFRWDSSATPLCGEQPEV